MKLIVVCSLVAVLFFGTLAGCGKSNSGDKEELIALKREHDTRLTGLCLRGGKYVEKSFHISAKVPCEGKTIDVEKYLEYKEYFAVPGKEMELRKYLSEPKN